MKQNLSTMVAVLSLLWCGSHGVAVAQAPRVHRFQPPPPPSEEEPLLGIDVHIGFVAPLSAAGLCPGAAGCIFGGGAGIGASIEQRWPDGFGLLLGYDLWMLNGAPVYELPVMHQLRLGARWIVPLPYSLRPTVEASVGALVLGDSFGVQTVGGSIQAAVGLELEVSTDVVLTAAVLGRGLGFAAFTTPKDLVQRGGGYGPDFALSLQIGVVILREQAPPF